MQQLHWCASDAHHTGCSSRKSLTRVTVKCMQLKLARLQKREADLRKRMLNVVAAYNVAVEGHGARTQAVAEKIIQDDHRAVRATDKMSAKVMGISRVYDLQALRCGRMRMGSMRAASHSL